MSEQDSLKDLHLPTGGGSRASARIDVGDFGFIARTRTAWALLILLVSAAYPLSRSFAGTNGRWTDVTSGGLWSTSTNWSGGAVADGIDSTADFSTLNILANNTVHLDTPRSIGTLLFGDTVPSANWTLDNNGLATDILTLATSTNSPTITVNNQSTTISTVLAGNQGFNKAGDGTLILNAANTYGGTTTLTAGTIQMAGTGTLGAGFSDLTINGGTLDLHGTNQVINGFSGSPGTAILNNVSGTHAVLTIGNGNDDSSSNTSIRDNTSGTGTLALVKSGSGFASLSGTLTYSGGTTIRGGGLDLEPFNSQLSTKGTLTFASSGAFGFVGTGVTSQALGTLSFAAGDGEVGLYASPNGCTLSFASVIRAMGATGDFGTANGANGTQVAIVLSGVPKNSFINPGLFFEGNLAWYDTAGFVRAVNFGIDQGTTVSAGGTSVSGTIVETTGAIAAQTTTTLTALNISGANNFTMAGGATLTVNAILKSGGNSATLSGGALIQPPANRDLVIRTSQSTDVLTVSTAIATTGANSFSVSGPGTVVLNGANTFGGVALNGGVLNVGSSGALGSSGTILFNGGTLQYSAANISDYSARFATSDFQRISIDTNGQNVSLGTVLSGTGTSLTKVGAGTLSVNGANNYTGVTNINGGVLTVNSLGNVNTPSGVGKGSPAGSASDLAIGNGTLQYIGTSPASTNRLFTVTDIVNGISTIDSSSVSPASTLSFTNPGKLAYLDAGSQSATLSLSGSNTGANTFAPAIADAGGGGTAATNLVKNGSGNWILTGANTYSGGTNVTAGTLTLDANTGKLQGNLYVAPGATFIYQGASTGSSAPFSILDGGGTIASVYGGSGNTVVTFSFISGSLYTFVVSGGINGVNNKIVIGGQPPPSGQFFGFSALFASAIGATPSYAWIDAGSYVRAINYGVDPGAVATNGAASVSGTYVQVNGPVTGEATNSLSTLNINGANDFTLASGATLTVSGILKTGNNAAVISGGAGIRPPPSVQMIICTGLASDTLTVATPILANNGGAVLINGPGTVILAAANTYTAGTLVNSGTLQVGNANALRAGSVNLGSAANLIFNSGIGTFSFGTLGGSADVALTDLGGNPVSLIVGTNISGTTYSGVFSGNGSLTVNGGFTMGLASTNTYSGRTTLDRATILVHSLANIDTPSGIGRGSPTGSAGDLVFGGGSLVCVPNSPAATNRLFTIGDSSGNSATIESDSASPANTLSFTSTGAIALVNSAPHTLQLNAANSGPNLFAPSISDQSAANPTNLVEGGNGTWLLRGANTYSGGTNIQGGLLNVDSDAELGAPPAVPATNITFGRAGTTYSQPPTFTLQFAANMTLNANRSTTLVSAVITGAFDTQNFDVAYGGIISGLGKFAKQGAGTLTLTGPSTYSGATTISAGTLLLGNGGTVGSLSPSSAITNNGALLINRSNAAVQGVDFSSAAITGSGKFIQAGAGTTTLTAANTYGGGTDIQHGLLKVNNASGSGTGSGTVTVESLATLGGGFGSSSGATGATLHGGVYDGSHVGIISGAITVMSGGAVAPGNSVGTLTAGGLTLGNGSILDYEFNNTPANDFTVVTNSNGLVLNGGPGGGAGFNLYAENTTTPFNSPGIYHLIHYAGSIQGTNAVASLLVLDPQPGFRYAFSNNLTLSDVDLTITSVPEPSSLALIMGGILFVAWLPLRDALRTSNRVHGGSATSFDWRTPDGVV